MALLNINDLRAHYQMIEAVRGVSISVDEGEIVTILGANGAGKSTILKCISGLMRPTSGEIQFAGQSITEERSDKIVALGIAQVPEGRRLFPFLTVVTNLRMGAYLSKDKRQVENDVKKVFEDFPALKARAKLNAGSLSGGEQQMLAMARALMARPKLLMLDEPSLGLAPMLVERVAEIITRINATGVTILLVEQNAYMALGVAHRAYVLETGNVALSGSAKDVMENEHTKKAYLGV